MHKPKFKANDIVAAIGYLDHRYNKLLIKSVNLKDYNIQVLNWEATYEPMPMPTVGGIVYIDENFVLIINANNIWNEINE